MAEKIKKHKDMFFVMVIGLVLAVSAILALSGVTVLPNLVSAATDTDQVLVTATIEPGIAVNIVTSTLPLGVLVTSAGESQIGSASTSVEVGTNDPNGWQVTIEGVGNGTSTGGLFSTTRGWLIQTATSVAVGVDGYGAQATTTEGDVTIDVAYDLTGNTVGLIPYGSSPEIATGDARELNHAFTLTVKASAQTDTPDADDYQDTITLTATVALP